MTLATRVRDATPKRIRFAIAGWILWSAESTARLVTPPDIAETTEEAQSRWQIGRLRRKLDQLKRELR